MNSGRSSTELLVMLHPVRTYRALALSPNVSLRRAVLRPLLSVLVVGVFVSITTSGALLWPLVADGALFWSFLPVLQAVAIVAVTLVFARDRLRLPAIVDAFFAGQGPWLMWLLLIAGLSIVLPPSLSERWIAQSWSLATVTGIAALVWSNVTSLGFLRGALGLTAVRAGMALLLYNAILWGVIVGYLLAVESLQLFRVAGG